MGYMRINPTRGKGRIEIENQESYWRDEYM
jgi:hypothetical protein